MYLQRNCPKVVEFKRMENWEKELIEEYFPKTHPVHFLLKLN